MSRSRYLAYLSVIAVEGLFMATPALVADELKTTAAATVYVSKILEGMVVAIDAHSLTVAAVLHTGTHPAEVTRIDALDRAYVADLADGTVTVMNTTDHTIVETIDAGHPVAASDADQVTQVVYALDFSNGTPGTNIHEIDTGTNTETADVAIGSQLQNIAVDSSNGKAYATDFVQGVFVIDTSDLTVDTTLSLPDLPHGVAVHPGLGRLYVTRLEADSVTVYNTATLSVVVTLSVGDVPQWIGVDTIRNKAFVTNEGDGTVSVIDLIADTVKPTTIPVGADPLTVTVHEPTAGIYVYNAGDGTISIIDAISETVVATIDLIFGDGFEAGEASAWSVVAP